MSLHTRSETEQKTTEDNFRLSISNGCNHAEGNKGDEAAKAWLTDECDEKHDNLTCLNLVKCEEKTCV